MNDELPYIKCNLDSGTRFGFWDVFWILGSVLGSGTCFWILVSVLGSGTCFWILGSVLDSGTCFWILGRVLDSGKCFVPTSHRTKWKNLPTLRNDSSFTVQFSISVSKTRVILLFKIKIKLIEMFERKCLKRKKARDAIRLISSVNPAKIFHNYANV